MSVLRPYPYQQDALGGLARARREKRTRTLVVMATGLGKTVVSAFEVKRLLAEAPGRVLYLCHNNEILRQSRKTFQEVLGSSYSFGYFHGTEKNLHEVDVLFASFQTMATWRVAFRPDEFRYIIVDEVHHAHAATFRPTVEYFQPVWMVGLTATPQRSDGLDVVQLFGGHVAYRLELFEALARRYLCHVDYRLMTDEIQNAGVLDTPVGKLSIAELNRTIFIPKRDEEIARIIREKAAAVKHPRVIVFCASIEHAERMARLLPHAAVLHSKLHAVDRDHRMQQYRRGKITMVVTVDMLNEGVDIPEANVLVFLRSTASPTVFRQQFGRGLRRAQGKLSVLVLDFVANCERIEMIDRLTRAVRQAQESLRGREAREAARQPQPITLTLDGGNFDERVMRVMEVIRGVRGGYTKEILTQQLRAKARELGRAPTAREAEADPRMAGVTAFFNVFRTTKWNEILMAAGFTPNVRRGYTKELLAEQLLAKARELGRTPTQSEVDADPNMASAITFSEVFGTTWNNVLCDLGLPLTRRMGYTKAELTQQLLRKAQELGRAPTQSEVNSDPKMASTPTFNNVFGAQWNPILREVGLVPRTSYTKAELTQQVLVKARELGRAPKQREVNADPNMASVTAFTRAFDLPWSGVLREVGLKE